jgi:hypothetical protein
MAPAMGAWGVILRFGDLTIDESQPRRLLGEQLGARLDEYAPSKLGG